MTKSRTIRKAGAVVLSLAMALSTLAIAPSADAAAKKPALASKKGTITVGSSKTVKIKNVTKAKVKKLAVKTSKKAVATVAKAGSGKKTAIKVTGKKAGKATITATVTLKKKVSGKTKYALKYTATVKAKATPTATPADAAVKVTLSYSDSAQADGTYLTGGKISLSYGSSLGVPYSITWYRDDVVVKQNTSDGGTLNEALTLDTTDANAPTNTAGTFYAEIKNTEGKIYKSENTITLVSDEIPAVLTDFAITDDYKTFANLAFDTKTNNAVASVTLNKDYAGTFYLIKASETKYIKTATETSTGYATSGATGNKIKTKAEDMTEANAISEDIIKIVNADKSVKYMFKISSQVTRGDEYKLIFDQTKISTDDLGTDDNQKVNITSAAQVQYLTAPASIALSKRKAGSAAEVKVLGSDNKELSWFGNKTAGTALSSLGVADFAVYEEVGTAKDKKSNKGATSDISKEGIITTTGELTAAGQFTYYWAYIKLAAGVYGKEAIELQTNVLEGSVEIATAVEISYDKSAPKTATVGFTNVLGAGTVYVAESSNNTEADIIKNATGSVSVSKGDTKVTIENAIPKAASYVAVLVPSDAETYVSKTSGTKTVSGELAKYAVAHADAIVTTGNAASTTTVLIAYDQYGNKLGGVPEKTYTAKAVGTSETSAGNFEVKINASEDSDNTKLGESTAQTATSSVAPSAGVKYSLTLSTGQVLTMEIKYSAAGDVTLTNFTI